LKSKQCKEERELDDFFGEAGEALFKEVASLREQGKRKSSKRK